MRRALRWVLIVIAVVYAALACLRTVGDFDSGWHLATGRYLLEHRAVPSTDILSYTSAGAAWHYPPFAGAFLYSIFRAAGYAGLSWFTALAAALLAVYLLWRATPRAGLAPAVLLMFAVPSLAYRLTPRADLFTTLFFAIFLAELWRFHRGERARLWLLPAAMLLWVNLHPGFIAGLALVAAYAACEALMLPFGDLRPGALRRLAKSWPWLVATAVAVLGNPWGVGALRQARELAGLGGGSQAGSHATSHVTSTVTQRLIGELSAQPLSWHVVGQALQVRDPDSAFWWLVLAACAAAVWALRRREFGAALLLAASVAAAMQKLRFQGLFSLVVIVVGGTLLADAFAELGRRAAPEADSAAAEPSAMRGSALCWAEAALILALCALGTLRIADLVSNRYYVDSASTSSFGAGESWWFPERAAAFIEREKLPGNIFQPYNLGGFTALRLGPRYPDYIDGRGVSGEISAEESALLASSPDSALWQQVAEQRNVNVILLSLARYGGLGGFDLNAFCGATHWRPVYLDEVSLVLVRRSAQTQPWLDGHAVDCQKFVLAPPGGDASHKELYDFYANSGAVYYALARDSEAEAAWQHALALEPEDPNIHLFLAQLYQQQLRPADAEREYRAALARRESAGAWYALGRLLAMEHRYTEAEPAIATAAEITATPANQYKALGQVQLHLNPEAALASFARAERAGPVPDDPSPVAVDFRLQLDDGRAAAWLALHDPARAAGYAEEAVRLAPVPKRWNALADCYAAEGRATEAEQARSRAQAAPGTQ